MVDSGEDASAPAESVKIEVMLAPIVLRNGRLIRPGQVAVRRGAPREEVGG